MIVLLSVKVRFPANWLKRETIPSPSINILKISVFFSNGILPTILSIISIKEAIFFSFSSLIKLIYIFRFHNQKFSFAVAIKIAFNRI